MKKSIYPIIATLKFRSKHIKVDLPIRIRYFELNRTECKSCTAVGTLKDLSNYYTRNYADSKKNKKSKHIGIDMTDFAIGNQHYSMPSDIFKNLNTIYCPRCLLTENKEVLMVPSSKEMYCLYCSTAPDYIKVHELIERHLYGRWKLDDRNYRREKPVAYFNTLEECYKVVNRLKKQPAKKRTKRGQKIMISIDKTITEKQLKKLYEQSLKRSFARRI